MGSLSLLIKKLSNVSTLVGEFGAEGIFKKYFGVDNYTEYNPQYKCLCSREYIEEVLVSSTFCIILYDF